MPSRASYRLICLIIGIALLLMAGACNPESGGSPAAPAGAYPVESDFREFYNLLGGEKTLGRAISPLIQTGSVEMQYTEAALLRYDSQAASAAQKFSLAPLGEELHLSDPPIVLPDQEGERIVDGYLIYDEFVDLYDTLQGERFVGKPLTQVRIDTKRGRIEQYFTNLGFYRLLKDPPHTVHLLSYGAWKCDAYCHFSVQDAALVAPQPVYPEPFIGSLSRLGLDFTGRPLSAPYLAADGMLEQVYQYFVVFANPSSIRLVGLRPITAQVGYPPTPLVAKVEDNRLVFYPSQPGLGHEVPKVFEDYITLHGGLEISGMPTTEMFQEGSIYRQCFTNICLDYDPGAAESLRIRPAPLGDLFMRAFPPPGVTPAAPAPSAAAPGAYAMVLWEAHTLAASDQGQTVHVRITDASGQTPASGLAPVLTVFLPTGSQANYPFPATDASGQSSVDIPPVSAANGTIIPYQACLTPQGGAPQCTKDSYVIWGNP
jgi:hypothetical protein